MQLAAARRTLPYRNRSGGVAVVAVDFAAASRSWLCVLTRGAALPIVALGFRRSFDVDALRTLSVDRPAGCRTRLGGASSDVGLAQRGLPSESSLAPELATPLYTAP